MRNANFYGKLLKDLAMAELLLYFGGYSLKEKVLQEMMTNTK